MDTSTLLYLAIFFFILGAGIIGLVWVMIALFRSFSNRGKGNPSNDTNLGLLARLLRDLTNQELVVEMDGKTYKSASELSPAQQHRLGIISGVLVKWLQLSSTAAELAVEDQPVPAGVPTPGEQPMTAVPPVAAEQPEPLITPPPADASQPAETVPAPDQVVPTNGGEQPAVSEWVPEAMAVAALDNHTPPFTPEPEPEVKPVSTQIPDVVSGIFSPAPAPAPANKSIAMQINDILQEKITDSQFESRGISVSDGPDHGVLVTLDGNKYPGVKDVPDEEVRSLIRSAVLDWEKKSKSK